MTEDLIINNVLEGLCAVIFDASERVLMLFRSVPGEKFATGWEFVKGGLKVGETHVGAALREIFEETGLSEVELIAELPRIYAVDVRYRQKPYERIEKKALSFFYRGGDVFLDRKEHSQYEWMSISEACRVCWVEYGAEILMEAYIVFVQWNSSSTDS